MNRSARFMALAGVSLGLASSMCGCGLFGSQPQNQPQRPKEDLYTEMATAENAVSMPDAGKNDAIVVTVARDGKVFLGIDRFDSSGLSLRVRDLLANRVDKEVYIRADARAKLRPVEDGVDSLRAAGVDEIGLLVRKGGANGQQSNPDHQTIPTGLELAVPPVPVSGHSPVKQSGWGMPPPPPPLSTPSKGDTVVQILYEPSGTPAYKIDHADVQKAQLLPKLTGIYANRQRRVVYIQADDSLDFASVVEVIDIARGADIDHIVLLTPQLLAGH